MPHREDGHRHGQQHDVPHEHLTEAQHVEPGADAHRVKAVFGLARDPLGVEVLLHQVAGEGGADRSDEDDGPGDPGQCPPSAPGGHEELSPQVDDHDEHEQFHAPQVQAVDVPADA
ncbi:hypothetical protein ACVWZD_007184 [Streptomyces sp. TE3672]